MSLDKPRERLHIQATLSHYRILEQIGAGGMGVVYRAHDERLERDVALKVLPPGTLADDSARKRFRKEALALSQLNHPNIATVHDFDTQEGFDFLVTELIPGMTLDEKLAAGPLPEKEVVRIGSQLAEGLEAAHGHGVVHRDLKPSNLRLTPEGRLKVLDFGLAMRVAPAGQASVTRSVLEAGPAGTLAYMAPEQLRNEKVDARADLWAAGVVLYELATARRPFDSQTASALAGDILHQPPPAPQLLRPGLSPLLADIITKCLEKDPEGRYQSAKELRVDLRRLSTPETATGPALRGSRRQVPVRTLAAAAIVVVTILVAMATYAYFGRRKPAPPSASRITSLAVLPLANLSGDGNQDYFADGMTEALITDLSKIRALKVISRTSVMRYKGSNKPLPEIARELGVNGIIEGSVLRSGNRVRITAQLIDAASDTHLWANNFDRDLRDVLTLQSDVARTIAQEIRVAVTASEQQQLASAKPVDPEAHELYLEGRYYWWQRRPAEMSKAIAAFEQAIAIDPSYAPAYAGLADAYSISVDNGFLAPAVGKDKAKSAALKAVILDDSLPDAHVALGLVYDNYDWDWDRADAEFLRAIALNPNAAITQFAYAAHANSLGKHDEAIAANRRALELDPLATRINAHLAWVLYCARRYDEAIAASQKTLTLEPGDPMGLMVLGESYLQKGMDAQALVELEELGRVAGENPACCGPLARAYVAAGEPAKARRLIERWIAESKHRYKSPYVIAEGYVGLGNDEQIFAWLEKACQQRDPQFSSGNVDPIWDQFRSDRRFVGLLRRMNLHS